VIESCLRLDVPIRRYLAEVLPGMIDRSIQTMGKFAPTAYVATLAE
jgi:hypothetical protein